MLSFDTEDDSKGTTTLFCAYNGAEFVDIYGDNVRHRAADFLIHVGKANAWATNLEYDLSNVFGLDTSLITRHYNGSRLIWADIGSTVFLDTSNLSNPPFSVAKMGDMIGLPKLEMPSGYKVTPRRIEYCRRDAKITYDWVRWMAQKFSDMGVELRRTMAATSLAAFQGMYGYVPQNRDHRDFLRASYSGGRTEVFRVGPTKGVIHCCDVKSMYPSVMRDNVYPMPGTEVATSKPDLEGYGVIDATIVVPQTHIPVAWTRDTGKLIFPIGRMRVYLTFVEMREAMRHGAKIEEIHSAIQYTGTSRPFQQFVDTFFEWRKRGYEQAKFILNSLYGKFGESGEGVSIGPAGRIEETRQPKHANIVWASYITSYARLKLHRAMMQTIEHGAEVLYCDTDSIFYRHPTRIWDEKDIGGLEHKDTQEFFHARQPKDYLFGSEYHVKGVPRKQAQHFFMNNSAFFTRPNRFRESLYRGLIVNEWCEMEKTLKSQYDKRIAAKDGSTNPVTVNYQ